MWKFGTFVENLCLGKFRNNGIITSTFAILNCILFPQVQFLFGTVALEHSCVYHNGGSLCPGKIALCKVLYGSLFLMESLVTYNNTMVSSLIVSFYN